jgi:hypothetical protein
MILRLTVFSAPGSYQHPVLGRISRPGHTVFSQEGFSRTYTNALGMRGAELAPKRPTEIRILIIGDSLTHGKEVADGATFSEQLQVQLEQGLKRPVTVVNAGRGGASSAYYLHLSSFYTQVVAPDFTVIQLDDSDFSGEAFDQSRSFYFVAEAKGFKTVAAPSIPDVSYSPIEQIAGVHPLLKPMTAFQGLMRSTIHIAVDKARHYSEGHNRPLVSHEATGPGRGHSDHGTGLVQWAIPRLSSSFPRPVFLFLPNESVPPTGSERLTAATVRAHAADYLNPRREFLSAVHAFQPPRGFNNTVPGQGHLNEVGHRLVAAQLTAFFKKQISP